MLALRTVSLPTEQKIGMSLSREYRIRELYLKFFEENFSRERVREFVSLLGDSEVRLLKRLSKLKDHGYDTEKERIFYALVYSLFDVHTRGRHRISSLKELGRFKRHYSLRPSSSEPDNRIDIAQALMHCKLSWILNEKEADTLTTTITLFQEFLTPLDAITLPNLSKALKTFVLQKVSSVLDDDEYAQKVRLYGQLIQTPTHETASHIEAIRLALQCMPIGDQKSANTFLYVTAKVYGVWPDLPIRLLQVPVDTDLSRVIFRIGLTRKQLGNLESGTMGYAAVQSLAKRLVPENPSALYSLKHVAKVWCRSRSTDCSQCPMSSVCTYAQSALL